MVVLSASPDLSAEGLNLFHTTEPLLSDAPILVFRGPASSAAAATVSSSRIQIHVFTAAGFQSYSRLAISPSSPLYGAVSRLSREDQGDEVCRELAYGLFKYFSELPQQAKDAWIKNHYSPSKSDDAIGLFTEQHAAAIASRMQPVEDTRPAIEDIQSALASKSISYQDADVILPFGSTTEIDQQSLEWAQDNSKSSYGKYAELISLLGESAFLPTSKIRRAPSRPTARNHSLKYTTAQKETLRREMCELVDTEESYVEKLEGLLNGIAADVRTTVRHKPQVSAKLDAQHINLLFPPSLDGILQVNAAFMRAIRASFDETETEAINDIQNPQRPDGHGTNSTIKDSIGVCAFAKCLSEHLPRFHEAYAAYITSHEGMAQTLKFLLQQEDSDVSLRLRDAGEKKLASLLIEPVQRLPRYSLYIENMVKQLPTQHPALKQLLKAKDTIADICSNDASVSSQSRVVAHLKSQCRGWPSTQIPRCRLITAFDLVELHPPYNLNDQPQESSLFVALLFADVFILLQKPPGCTITARSLLASVENPALRSTSDPVREEDTSLVFVESTLLHDLRVTEMQGGQVIQLAARWPSTQRHGSSVSKSSRAFYLSGQYESRASKFTKEFTKARIEGRFSEQERDSPRWQARDLDCNEKRLGLFTAIFEDRQTAQGSNGSSTALVKLVLDPDKHRTRYSPTKEGADTVASLTVAGNGFFRLEVDSIFFEKTKDFVTGSEFISVLTKRLTTLAQMRGSLRNPLLTAYLLQHYDIILKAVRLPGERLSRSPSRTKMLRQHSPVKAIASLFGGSTKSSHEQQPLMQSTNLSRAASRPQLAPKSRSESRIDVKAEQLTKSTSIATIVSNDSNVARADSQASLDAALGTFILALRARKGNIIGRVIANRSAADETTVNQLYNALLEHPEDHEPTSQAPVDALFAAFERFLKVAWREKFGSILETRTLNDLQIKASTLSPIDYEELLSKTIDDMIPQNRRAFRGVIGLLIDLLGGTGNDGDRGALMATITEIMVCEDNPHDYMPLFDRLVEDHDVILSETFHSTTPHYGTAARSTNTGSFSSKASSWSKRLGFGSLGRKNSRADTKPASHAAQSSPRAFLERTKSVDWSKVPSPLSRPGSKDRLPTSGEGSRPGTGKSWDRIEPLETLKPSGVFGMGSSPRKKRRSSLSDIEGLPSVNTSPFWNSPAPRRPENSPLMNRAGASPLRQETPSILSRPRPRLDASSSPPVTLQQPSQSPFIGHAAQSGYATVTPTSSPTRSNAVRRRAPTMKENERPNLETLHISPSATHTLSRAQTSPSRHQRAPSNLPPPRGPLTERAASGNTPPPPSRASSNRKPSDKDSSPSKLRTSSPSPAKALQPRPRAQTTHQPSTPQPGDLTSRITANHTAIAEAETGILSELAKIEQEISAPHRREDSVRQGGTGTTPRKENLEGRLRALEQRVPHLMRVLEERTQTLEEEAKGELERREQRIEELEVALGIR